MGVNLEKYRETLLKADFLAHIPEATLRDFVAAGREITLRSGQLIFEAGDSGDCMYIVIEGQLLIYRDETELSFVVPGGYFGEMAMLEGQVRSASVKALERARLMEVSQDTFTRFISPHPDALIVLLKTLSTHARLDLDALSRNYQRLREYSTRVEATNRELYKMRSDLVESNRELERLSSLDALTGISNRRRFDYVLSEEWRRAARAKSPMALIMLDIDHFKSYNDAHGHVAGDHVLTRVGEIMESAPRRAGDLVARYGGEEFAFVLAETGPEGATQVAEAVREEVLQLKIAHGGSSVHEYLTISAGVASVVPKPSDDPTELIQLADQALYLAKQRGRNRVEVSGPESAEHSQVS